MFDHVQPYAGDPILSLVDAYNADPRPGKVNLSIGIYFDEQGRLPVLPSVHLAEQRILAEGGAKPYLPMEGDPAARAQVQALLLGPGHPALAQGRVVTVQSVGSSGGLKVGADFLKAWLPDVLDLEPRLDRELHDPLAILGHKTLQRSGGAVSQAVSRMPDGLRAGSDPRKGGRPAGW